MRRKSERNKSKSAVEKKTADTTPRKTRRTSRRRKRSTSHSSSEDSDDAPLKPAVVETQVVEVSPPSDEPKVSGSRSNSDEDKQEEQPIWKVKTTEAPSGEIQKLKICLQRPPTTPERTEKSPRRRRGKASSQSDDASLTPEEKPHKRKTRRSSPAAQVAEGSSMDNSIIEDAEKDECLIIVKETNEVMIGKGKLDCSQPSQDSENEECIQDSRTEVQPDESLIESKIEQDMEQDSAPIIKDADEPQEQQDDEKKVDKQETINETSVVEQSDVTEAKLVDTKSKSDVQKIEDTDNQAMEIQEATKSDQPLVVQEIISTQEIKEDKETDSKSQIIEEQVNKIKKTEIKVEEKRNEVEEQESNVEEQESKVEEVQNKVEDQKDIVEEQENKVNVQENTVKEQENTVKEQENTVKEQENTVKEQENTVKEQENTVKEQENTVKEQENIVEEQEKIVEEKIGKIVSESSNKELIETSVIDKSTESNDKPQTTEVTTESEKHSEEPIIEDSKETQSESVTESNESVIEPEVQATKIDVKSEPKEQSTEMEVKTEPQEKESVQSKPETATSVVKHEEKNISKSEEPKLSLKSETVSSEVKSEENEISEDGEAKLISKSEPESSEVKSEETKISEDEESKLISKSELVSSEAKCEQAEIARIEECKLISTDNSTNDVAISKTEDETKIVDIKCDDADKMNESSVEDNKSTSEVKDISSEKDQDSKPASPENKICSIEEKMEEDLPERIIRKRHWGKYSAPLIEEPSITLNVISSLFPSLKMLNMDELKLETEEPVKEPKIVKKEREVTVQPPSSPKEEDSEKEVSNIGLNRKISIVNDEASKLQPPPSPAKNHVSSILYITNLVRPFTIKQLQELLSRTGKIVEDGFWTDKIKSKCYVQYETDEEAEGTRNALHGVQWPTGNGKKLIIDFGTIELMATARNAVIETVTPKPVPDKVVEKVPEYKKEETVTDDDRWEKARAAAPIREWDLGKVPQEHRDRSRSRDRNQARSDRSDKKRPPRAESPSNGDHLIPRKKKKEETEVKMMDDLFHKTKAIPSIYWLPLSPEQIAKKQQQRLQRMAEHKRRMEESRRMERDFGRGAPRSRRRSARYDGD